MAALWGNVKLMFQKYPLTRGMASYALIWPAGNFVHQTLDGKRWGTYDWTRVGRFMLFGCVFVAPTLYCWIKASSSMWPRSDIYSAVSKALVEQLSYTPAAMTCFYFGMSLLEGKTFKEAATEVQHKFIPTYRVAVVVWPFVSTINFWLIPEKNRVVFVSICSLMWSSFLAWMKHMEKHEIDSLHS